MAAEKIEITTYGLMFVCMGYCLSFTLWIFYCVKVLEFALQCGRTVFSGFFWNLLCNVAVLSLAVSCLSFHNEGNIPNLFSSAIGLKKLCPWNGVRGASSFCPVCHCGFISHHFCTVKDKDFIFDMHTQLAVMKPFQMKPMALTL